MFRWIYIYVHVESPVNERYHIHMRWHLIVLTLQRSFRFIFVRSIHSHSNYFFYSIVESIVRQRRPHTDAHQFGFDSNSMKRNCLFLWFEMQMLLVLSLFYSSGNVFNIEWAVFLVRTSRDISFLFFRENETGDDIGHYVEHQSIDGVCW